MSTEAAIKAAKKKQNRVFRRKWIPAIRSTFSSGSDLIGDWTFYFYTRAKDGLGAYDIPVLVFAMIASVFGLLTIVSIFLKNCSPEKKSEGTLRSTKIVNSLLSCEIFLEDIPQFILTIVVMSETNGGTFSNAAIFNLTTSGFNLVFNLLDIFYPLPEEEEEEEENHDEEFNDDP